MLDTQINQAFLEAYKAKNEELVSTLRMLKSAILNKKIEKKMSKEEALPDEEIISVLKSEAKKRADSVEAYRSAGREELATKEEAEINIIKQFLPEQLSEEAVREIVKSVLAEIGEVGPAGFGKIMGSVMAKTNGAADGAIVTKVVKEELAK